MRQGRFTEDQIIGVLREHEAVMKKLKGRPSSSLTACSLVFIPPLVRPIQVADIPFFTSRLDAVRCAFR